MKNIFAFLFLILITFCLGCGTSSTEEGSMKENKKDTITIQTTIQDTIQDSKDSMDENGLTEMISVKDWKIEDFIVNEKDKSNTSLKNTIAYERKQWEKVENPLVAKYQGCDFGDYFHLNFADEAGKFYDFGSGENELGEYTLYTGDQFVDNPKYLGKTFKIYWTWKKSTFPCCEGDQELMEAYLPAIVKLEIVE